MRNAEDRPNIIFIFADDWGYGDLGVHGSTFCRTPRIDRMAREGIDFQDFSVSHPVCSPSRTSIMTGHYPARYCVHEHFATWQHHVRAGMPDWLDPAAPMLPRMLKAAGYTTGHFGKWHLCNDQIPDGPMPEAYGYDEFGAFNLPGDAPEQMSTCETCPRAAEFIRRHAARPFFINLWLHEPHTPHYPRAEYLQCYDGLDEQRKAYGAIIAEGDAGVGLILDTLEAEGLDGNTLVIFSSDHGPEWVGEDRDLDDTSTGPGLGSYYSVGENGGLKGNKRSLYAGGLRVPFIVRWPGVVPEGRIDRCSAPSAVDVLPTFVELAGARMPDDYTPDGESLVRAIKGAGWTRSKPIFWEWQPACEDPYLWPQLGVRDGKWKLLLNESLDKVELYNIEADWAEQEDLASRYPRLVTELIQKLTDWKAGMPNQAPEHCMSVLRKIN